DVVKAFAAQPDGPAAIAPLPQELAIFAEKFPYLLSVQTIFNGTDGPGLNPFTHVKPTVCVHETFSVTRQALTMAWRAIRQPASVPFVNQDEGSAPESVQERIALAPS